MRSSGFILAFVLAVVAAPSNAHDIGISKSELREYSPGTYQLRVESGTGGSSYFKSPQLPEHCQYQGPPSGAQGTSWKSWSFACVGGLLPADVLVLPWDRDGVMLEAHWFEGGFASSLFKNQAGVITVRLDELRIRSGTLPAAVKRYVSLGIEHILEGYDHLLFVFALLLIVSSGWRLVKTITAFTLAHSVTLALATLGFVQVPPRPVEAVIALSIVFLAAEIIHKREGRTGLTYRSPWLIAFGFGLLHGFGFAGALSEIGLPQAELPVALLFFNIGVEIGQLLFVFAVITLKRILHPIGVKQRRWMQALSAYAIGTVAMFWLLQRMFDMLPQSSA